MEPRKTGVKPKFKYNKIGKFTKKEEKEVQRTSKNIFDYDSDIETGMESTTTTSNSNSLLQVMNRAGEGEHEHGGEVGVGGMLLFA